MFLVLPQCQHCFQSGCVTDEALGMSWYSYPVKMQKKLLLIRQVTAARPMAVTMYGLFPFNRETYYSVSR